MKDCFIYVSQIPQTGNDGQNKFEKGVISTLLERGKEGQEFEIKIFSASTNNEISKDEKLVLIPLKKNGYPGFISHQLRLLFSLGNYLWGRRKNNLYMFARYHPAMFAPLVLAFLFDLRLTIRTGPVLPNLFLYKKYPGPVTYHIIKWLLGVFYKKASSIITVTEKIKQWVVETYQVDPKKIQVIPNAADTTLFYPEPAQRKEWNIPENDFVFGFVGAMYETQGLGTIFQALGKLKKKQGQAPLLFLVGDGEYCAELKALSKKLNIFDHIIWTGNIPHEQVRSAINCCDMMLAPFKKQSLELKGSSALKLWEYLACDKPVLASKFKDHQFLEELNLGRTVEPDNIELWAEALHQESIRKNLNLAGRGHKFVIEEHSFNLVVEKIFSISFGVKIA